MTPTEKKPNGNLVKVLMIVVMASYIGVKDIAAPLVKEVTGEKPATAPIVEKIARLEECVKRLDRVPEGMAAQYEAIASLKTAVERLERKIDNHVAVDPRRGS